MIGAASAAELPGLALNPNARIQVLKIGHEQQPVFVVDQALIDAEAMVEFACEHTTFSPPPTHYPGLVAPLPANYGPNILAALRRPLEGLFGYTPGPGFMSFGFYGLTTVPQAALLPDQLIPHVDSISLHAYATVHFLSSAEYGGTAFYRHRSTGLEVITPAKAQACDPIRTAELKAHEGRPKSELPTLYEEIAYIEPVFNRLILYRANQLHCAKMTSAETLPDDPRTGRLTANLFVNTQ